MTRQIYSPQELAQYFQNRRSELTDFEFINSPTQQSLKDVWLAAHFGRAYSRVVRPCGIAIDVDGDQEDSDFELVLQGTRYPFQSTEVMEPGRRRGDEYRAVEAGDRPPTELSDWEPGTSQGSIWVAEGVRKKVARGYSRVSQLNLLVYANFFAYQLDYGEICAAVKPIEQPFRSIWLITGQTLASIKGDPHLGSVSGWGLLDNYTVNS